jgi:hypothetical protein
MEGCEEKVRTDDGPLSIEEPGRKIPIIAQVDVLIVGGGPSGVCAAVAAARAGSHVLLVEQYGFSGGMWTAGMVLTLAGFNSWLRPYSRCAGGIAGEWLRRAASIACAEDNESWVLNSDPEGMKLVADRLLEDAGVEVLYHTWGAMPIMQESKVIGVYIENVDGRSAILAKVTVDCTGNGDIIARSGARWEKADTLQPMTMPFTIGNVQIEDQEIDSSPRCIPIGPQPTILEGTILTGYASRRTDIEISLEGMREARHRGELPLYGGPWFGGLHKEVVWVNTTRIVGDASIARDFTRAEIEGRRSVPAFVDYFRKSIPGFEQARLLQTSPQVGIRETRRLRGRYCLSGEDVRNNTSFEDAIGLGCWPIDVHPVDRAGIHAMYVPLPFQIPYRCLLPCEVGGLLTAGRCISVDREALATVRVGATCGVTGQAAGVAAAVAVRDGVEPADIDCRSLRRVLRDQGALIDAPEEQR